MISIIIPVYNEEKDIVKCLESLNEQSYQDFEIIIIDDGSTDRTKEKIKEVKTETKILEQNHGGPGLARNLGAGQAKGEILIFIDADMTFEKDYLKNLIKPIVEDKTGEIIGTTHELEVVNNTENIWSRCWGRIRVSKEEAKDVKIFRAIRKNNFLEYGGFDAKYGYADDQTFWFKYKIKPVVANNTVCYHKNPETLKGVYAQSRWIGGSHSVGFVKLIGMLVISPVSIPLLAIRKCLKNKELKILGYMLIFMTARYFGNLAGYWNKLIWKRNSK